MQDLVQLLAARRLQGFLCRGQVASPLAAGSEPRPNAIDASLKAARATSAAQSRALMLPPRRTARRNTPKIATMSRGRKGVVRHHILPWLVSQSTTAIRMASGRVNAWSL